MKWLRSTQPKISDNNDIKEIKVKNLTDIIGEFGRWQMWLTLYVFFIKFGIAFNNMGFPFHAFKVDFWCDDVPKDYQVRLRY